jgi:hypothetical protein
MPVFCCAGLQRADIDAGDGQDSTGVANVVITDSCSAAALRVGPASESGAAARVVAGGSAGGGAQHRQLRRALSTQP